MHNSGELRKYEQSLYAKGCRFVAGIDEAGRGPLAGPVYASAVILPHEHGIVGIRDSKKISPKKRELLFEQIKSTAVAFAIVSLSHDEIDKINILKASLKAMALAVEELSIAPDHLLIDGNMTIASKISQTAIVKGDNLSESIAAASILAKVARDAHMCEMQKAYPQFSFSKHKGYGTAVHIDELRKYGPTPIHRKTFLSNF